MEASRSVTISLDTNWRAVVVDASNKHIQTIKNNSPCRYQIRDDSLVGELERLISKIIPKEVADKFHDRKASPLRICDFIADMEVHVTRGSSLYKKVLRLV